MTACIDSDVLIDFFNGVTAAADEIEKYNRLHISRITWMEVLIGARTDEMRTLRESFLELFTVIELSENVARRAIALLQEHRLKLPDAIIWSSAMSVDALLVTRNTKDFAASHPGIRIPYQLESRMS